MTLVGQVLVGALLLTVFGWGGLSVVTWWNRHERGVLWFSIHAAHITGWVLLDLTSVVATDVRASIWLMSLGDALANTSALFAFLFVLGYLGYRRPSLSSGGLIGGLYLGGQLLAAVVGVLTDTYYRNVSSIEQFGLALPVGEQGPLIFLSSTPSLLLNVFSIALVARAVLTSDRAWLSQAVSLILALAFPLVGSMIVTLGVPPEGFPTIPLFVAGSLVLYVYALSREDLFALSPASERIGVRQAFDDLGAGVLVVDNGTVLRANETVQRILDRDRQGLVGASVEDALAPFGRPDVTSFPIDVELNGRFYELSVSTVGEEEGYAVLVQDVTERRQREQRLAVLNRVLRHNLRNDIDVIRGRLEAATERVTDETTTEHLTEAVAITGGLIDLAENARAIETVVDEDGARSEQYSFVEAVEHIVADLEAAHPDAEISIAVDGAPTCRLRPDLADAVLENVIENAVVHNDGTPTVEVTVEADDSGVTVVVVDDGPGIPDEEVRVLERGDETPLEHGSGLGLWLVNWAMTQVGGSITFERTETGSRVALRFPDGARAEGP